MEVGLTVKLLLIVKAIAEIAFFALIGQGIVALFAGADREKNVVYQIFKIITFPITWLARVLTPRKLVRETHLPLAAFFICFWIWLGAIFGMSYTCAQAGIPLKQCVGKSS
jgi:hypothetical protein